MIHIIFICLACCCSSLMPLKQSESIVSEDHTQVVASKQRKEYAKTSSGYYRFATSDLFSENFLKGLISYYVNDLGVTELGINDTPVENYVLQTNNVYTCNAWWNQNYHHLFNVSNIVMSKFIRPYDSQTQRDVLTLEYNFVFSNASPYDKQIGVKWFAQNTLGMNGLIIYGVQLWCSGTMYATDGSGYYWSLNDLYPMFMLDEKIGGFNAFIGNIFNSIKGDPYNQGYNAGYIDGEAGGYDVGYGAGLSVGVDEGYELGYQSGYSQGVNDTQATGTMATEIFGGILDVAFIPVNVFLLMFDYEVFGINIGGLVSGLITIALVIILIKFIMGNKV